MLGGVAQDVVRGREHAAAVERQHPADVVGEEVLRDALVLVAPRRRDLEPQRVRDDVLPVVVERDLHGVVAGLRHVPAVAAGGEEEGVVARRARLQDDLGRLAAVLRVGQPLPRLTAVLLEDHHQVIVGEHVVADELRLARDVPQLQLEGAGLEEVEDGLGPVRPQLQAVLRLQGGLGVLEAVVVEPQGVAHLHEALRRVAHEHQLVRR